MHRKIDLTERNFDLKPDAWAAVITALRSGIPQVLIKTFISRYDKFVFLLEQKVGKNADIGDIVLKAMTAIGDKIVECPINEVPLHGKLEGYVAQQCYWQCSTHFRKKKPDVVGEMAENDLADEGFLDEFESSNDAAYRKLSLAIQHLTSGQKLLVKERFLVKDDKGKSPKWEVVGEKLGINADAAKRRWKATIAPILLGVYLQLKKQFEHDLLAIQQYTASKPLKWTQLESGVSYTTTQTGINEPFSWFSNLWLYWESKFISGRVVDEPQITPLDIGFAPPKKPRKVDESDSKQVLTYGLLESLSYFNAQSQGIVLVPSELGYIMHPDNPNKGYDPRPNKVQKDTADTVLVYKIHLNTPNPANG